MSEKLNGHYCSPILSPIGYQWPYLNVHVEIEVEEFDRSVKKQLVFTTNPNVKGDHVILVNGSSGYHDLNKRLVQLAGSRTYLHNYDNAFWLVDIYMRLSTVATHYSGLRNDLLRFVNEGFATGEKEEYLREVTKFIGLDESKLLDLVYTDYAKYVSYQLLSVEKTIKAKRLNRIDAFRKDRFKDVALKFNVEISKDKSKHTYVIADTVETKKRKVLPIPYFFMEISEEGMSLGNHQGGAKVKTIDGILAFINAHVEAIKAQLNIIENEEEKQWVKAIHGLWTRLKEGLVAGSTNSDYQEMCGGR